MTGTALAPTRTTEIRPRGILQSVDFGRFLRLHVADGDASAQTIRGYWSHASHFVTWCRKNGVNPATATNEDIRRYRADLVGRYAYSTVAAKLSAVRRLYEAAVWSGLRADNPAAGLKARRSNTEWAERLKFLPLDGLRRLLDAPAGNSALAIRDRAILALLGRHGLRVCEIARPVYDRNGRKRTGLELEDLDLPADTLLATGKGRKMRTIYLTESSKAALVDWLATREKVAKPAETAVFVALDRVHGGEGISSRGIRYAVDVYLEEVGLKAEGISCHSLRHSAATWARAAGARLDAIGAMLGHASVTTTQVYAQIVDRMTENPAQYLETMLEG